MLVNACAVMLIREEGCLGSLMESIWGERCDFAQRNLPLAAQLPDRLASRVTLPGRLRDSGHLIERACLLLLVHLCVPRGHRVGDPMDVGSCDLLVEGGVLVVGEELVADVHCLHLSVGA